MWVLAQLPLFCFLVPRCGDELLEVGARPVSRLSLTETHALLSRCSPGPVPLTVGRHLHPQVRPEPLVVPPRSWRPGVFALAVVAVGIQGADFLARVLPCFHLDPWPALWGSSGLCLGDSASCRPTYSFPCSGTDTPHPSEE